MVKLSFMSFCLEKADPAAVVAAAQKCGLAAVDWITLHGSTAREIGKLCAGEGIAIAAHTVLPSEFCSGSPKAEDQIRRGFEDALTMGAPLVMVPPFPIGNGRSDVSAMRREWIGFYTRVFPMTCEYGLPLAIESTGFPNSPVVSGTELNEVMDAVPGLKLAFDCGNAFTNDDPVACYEAVKKRIIHVHLKDYARRETPAKEFSPGRSGKYYGPAVFGQGDTQIPELWKRLNRDGYSGYANLEICWNCGEKDIPAVAEAVRYLKSL